MPNRANKEPKVYEIKAWKIKDDCEIKYERNNMTYKYSKSTLFIQMEDGNIRLVKNSTESNSIIYSHARMILDDLIKNEQVEEVEEPLRQEINSRDSTDTTPRNTIAQYNIPFRVRGNSIESNDSTVTLG
jgi:uncharacterized Fe-S radical SAM superfamily protein PflX